MKVHLDHQDLGCIRAALNERANSSAGTSIAMHCHQLSWLFENCGPSPVLVVTCVANLDKPLGSPLELSDALDLKIGQPA
jgi:hypothetical protein